MYFVKYFYILDQFELRRKGVLFSCRSCVYKGSENFLSVFLEGVSISVEKIRNIAFISRKKDKNIKKKHVLSSFLDFFFYSGFFVYRFLKFRFSLFFKTKYLFFKRKYFLVKKRKEKELKYGMLKKKKKVKVFVVCPLFFLNSIMNFILFRYNFLKFSRGSRSKKKSKGRKRGRKIR